MLVLLFAAPDMVHLEVCVRLSGAVHPHELQNLRLVQLSF